MMPRLLIVGFLFVGFAFPVEAKSCSNHYLSQQPPLVPPPFQNKARELCFSAFAITHSGLSRTPLWAGEHLTATDLKKADALNRKDSFHPEEALPPEERAELNDYKKSGYDRGHLAPNGDMPTAKAQNESFSLANMIPQHPENNREVWKNIEEVVRDTAVEHGELYVVTGPLFIGTSLKSLHGRVIVPTHIFKAVYSPKHQTGGVYITENNDRQTWTEMSLDAFAQWSRITPFPSLPASVTQKKIDLPDPKAWANAKKHSTPSPSLLKFFMR